MPGGMLAPQSARPEVSSPILDGIERSCGSSALARASSSLSRTLSRHTSGSNAAAACASAKPAEASGDAAAGAGTSYHRHQRSGALDFDAVLLTADDENDEQENLVSVAQVILSATMLIRHCNGIWAHVVIREMVGISLFCTSQQILQAACIEDRSACHGCDV